MKRTKKRAQDRARKRAARAAGMVPGGCSRYATKVASLRRDYRIEGSLLLSLHELHWLGMRGPYIVQTRIVTP